MINTELPKCVWEVIWVLTTYCLWDDSRIYLLCNLRCGLVRWALDARVTSSCVLLIHRILQLFFHPTDLPIKRQREYELVTPVSTNFEGRYLSHILSANHKKRSTRDVSSNSEQLFFNITAFGRDFHLRLKPNTQLVAPGAVVEWHEASPVPGNITDPINDHQPGSTSDRIWKTEPLQTNCAYVGDIMDVPGTSVAISNCDGLVRLLAFCVCVFAGVWERSMTSAWFGR